MADRATLPQPQPQPQSQSHSQPQLQPQPWKCRFCHTNLPSEGAIVRLEPCKCAYCKDCMIAFLAQNLKNPAALRCKVCSLIVQTDHLTTLSGAVATISHNHPVLDDAARKRKSLPTTSPAAPLGKDSQGPGRPTKQPKKSFDERYKELERFKQRNHHCYVPDTNNEGERSFLSEWCRNVRSGRITVTPEQRKLLDDLGFPWEKRFDHDWNVMFQQLNAYKTKHGNCLVPWEWKEDPKLSRWVHTQRKSMSKERMREDRKKRLDALGMVWKPSETRKIGKGAQRYEDEFGFSE